MVLDLRSLELLPGAADENFEILTRAIIVRRFGAVGVLRERRQQPGVEFHIRVTHDGELGEPGRVWGWSCKWFTLNAANELYVGQREQIEDSLSKAVDHVDGLSDFVLCLPERPAKKDIDWIDGLSTDSNVDVHLWSAENYDAQLAGLDELRSTFFGELALTPEVLARCHERSIAPIAARWVPSLHTQNHIELRLDRILLRSSAFDWLAGQAELIAERAAAVRDSSGSLADEVQVEVRAFASDLADFATALSKIVDAARARRPAEVRERLEDRPLPATSPRQIERMVRQLRKLRHPAALTMSGLAVDIADATNWMASTRADLASPMVAVVAAAGAGKTHLAAQMSAQGDSPSAGVFIQGAQLRRAATLDDLAVRIPELKVECFDDLLEALESAGARAGQRIPLFIDGLNEAERPAEWRTLLDQVLPALRRYEHVLVIVTLREPLAEHALPDGAVRFDLEWQDSEARDVIRVYFDHYLINARGAWLPDELLYSPLLVRMYCEAVNSSRESSVGIEALPTSLVGVFELYRDSAVGRLARDPARKRLTEDQIVRRLRTFALALWERSDRRLPAGEARAILDDGEADWDESLFRRLEEEGVLLREEDHVSGDTAVGILFDRFAGYLMADALLVGMTYAEVGDRLAAADLWSSLVGDENRHPYGEDVALSLVGLVPRRFGGQHLWRHAPAEHRDWALLQELQLESHLLDEDTVVELAPLIVAAPRFSGALRANRRHPFDRLWEVRRSPAHRLNATFLDGVLRAMPVAQRDLRWSEWVRFRADNLLNELKRLFDRWEGSMERDDADDLEALGVAWLLTSTDGDLRDLATKALQQFGRPEPRRLFHLASALLDVDDPYVWERLLGACYGALGAHQMPDPGGPFEAALAEWLRLLNERYLSATGTPTSHEHARNYIRATFELAAVLHPAAVPDGVEPLALKFAPAPTPGCIAPDDPNESECAATLRMDFENYVVGAVIADRSNYDSDHPDFVQARGEVLARVWELGWRSDLFAEVDRSIAELAHYSRSQAAVERYGKKYGWIGYFELVGRLADAGQIRERWISAGRHLSPDIDPSFPNEPPAAPIALPDWAPEGAVDEREWIRSGAVEVEDGLWRPDGMPGAPGEWLLAEGFISHERDGHKVFGFFRTLLIESSDLTEAIDAITTAEYLGNDFLPALPTIDDVYCVEVPWSPRFQASYGIDAEPSPRLGGWTDGRVKVNQLAVTFASSDGEGPARLLRSYDVPSYEFAGKFKLRQVPGTLDLAALDGSRASLTFSLPEPWSGHLLFLRKDLVLDYAGTQRVVQVAWGEREVTTDWSSPPEWLREVHRTNGNLWRSVDVVTP